MNRTAPFPFVPIFQNGPRRQGCASPRKTGAPLTAPVRSENFPMRRERGRLQRQKNLGLWFAAASRWSAPDYITRYGVDKTS